MINTITKTSLAILASLVFTQPSLAVVDKAPPCAEVFDNQPLSSHYQDNDDGTLTDRRTNLTWYRCSAGQIWSNGTCKGHPILRNFADAQDWAAQAEVAGTTGWRLPEIDEMVELVVEECRSPSLDTNAFPGIVADNYWSSEDNFWSSMMAWSLFWFKGEYYSRQGKVFELRFMLVKD